MVDVPVQKRRGRPPKQPRPVEVVQAEAETPATVVRPEPDPEHAQNKVVEETDPISGRVIAVYPDAGEEVELPDYVAIVRDGDIETAIDRARELMAEATFEPVEYEVALSPREVEAAKDVPVIPEGVGIEKPEPVEERELSPQQVVALDRDYDGDAGGSRPLAKLTDLQRNAFMQDTVDAYEGQFEVKRTDAFNRVWTMRHETYQNRDHMLIRVDRGPTGWQRLISTAFFTPGHALIALEELDGESAR